MTLTREDEQLPDPPLEANHGSSRKAQGQVLQQQQQQQQQWDRSSSSSSSSSI
jgi:hypothetical protein